MENVLRNYGIAPGTNPLHFSISLFCKSPALKDLFFTALDADDPRTGARGGGAYAMRNLTAAFLLDDAGNVAPSNHPIVPWLMQVAIDYFIIHRTLHQPLDAATARHWICIPWVMISIGGVLNELLEPIGPWQREKKQLAERAPQIREEIRQVEETREITAAFAHNEDIKAQLATVRRRIIVKRHTIDNLGHQMQRGWVNEQERLATEQESAVLELSQLEVSVKTLSADQKKAKATLDKLKKTTVYSAADKARLVELRQELATNRRRQLELRANLQEAIASLKTIQAPHNVAAAAIDEADQNQDDQNQDGQNQDGQNQNGQNQNVAPPPMTFPANVKTPTGHDLWPLLRNDMFRPWLYTALQMCLSNIEREYMDESRANHLKGQNFHQWRYVWRDFVRCPMVFLLQLASQDALELETPQQLREMHQSQRHLGLANPPPLKRQRVLSSNGTPHTPPPMGAGYPSASYTPVGTNYTPVGTQYTAIGTSYISIGTRYMPVVENTPVAIITRLATTASDDDKLPVNESIFAWRMIMIATVLKAYYATVRDVDPRLMGASNKWAISSALVFDTVEKRAWFRKGRVVPHGRRPQFSIPPDLHLSPQQAAVSEVVQCNWYAQYYRCLVDAHNHLMTGNPPITGKNGQPLFPNIFGMLKAAQKGDYINQISLDSAKIQKVRSPSRRAARFTFSLPPFSTPTTVHFEHTCYSSAEHTDYSTKNTEDSAKDIGCSAKDTVYSSTEQFILPTHFWLTWMPICNPHTNEPYTHVITINAFVAGTSTAQNGSTLLLGVINEQGNLLETSHFAKVSRSGGAHEPWRHGKGDFFRTLELLNENPRSMTSFLGALSGVCCCCSVPLRSEKSLASGFDQSCGRRFHLQKHSMVGWSFKVANRQAPIISHDVNSYHARDSNHHDGSDHAYDGNHQDGGDHQNGSDRAYDSNNQDGGDHAYGVDRENGLEWNFQPDEFSNSTPVATNVGNVDELFPPPQIEATEILPPIPFWNTESNNGTDNVHESGHQGSQSGHGSESDHDLASDHDPMDISNDD